MAPNSGSASRGYGSNATVPGPAVWVSSRSRPIWPVPAGKSGDLGSSGQQLAPGG
jgi:hypothetical protein